MNDKHAAKAENYADIVVRAAARQADSFRPLDPWKWNDMSRTKRTVGRACDRAFLRQVAGLGPLTRVHALLEDDKEPSQ